MTKNKKRRKSGKRKRRGKGGRKEEVKEKEKRRVFDLNSRPGCAIFSFCFVLMTRTREERREKGKETSDLTLNPCTYVHNTGGAIGGYTVRIFEDLQKK